MFFPLIQDPIKEHTLDSSARLLVSFNLEQKKVPYIFFCLPKVDIFEESRPVFL